MKKWLLLSTLAASSAWGNLHLAPPDFDINGKRAVFVDFVSAHYDISYDLEKEEATVKSKIHFKSTQYGTPVFDLVPRPSNVRIDGKKVDHYLSRLPHTESKIRRIDSLVEPGKEYVLEMENALSRNVIFNRDFKTVSSAFWIRDLKDRMFLEQYVPSNFEFDQYKITMNVSFLGVTDPSQELFTNGKVTKINANTWHIEFPKYFTVSCPYFHTSSRGSNSRLDFTYKSIDGRDIPITVYSPWKSRTKKFKDETIKVMKELEADYGPWGHPSFVAYGTMPGTGGMEHSGATATSLGALDHEMLHSYFAKGIMPANGNSGWIDEGIASWRDRGYPRNPTPGFSGSNLGDQSPYKRNTDSRAYGLGSAFFSYIDYRLQNLGGLKAFLKGYFSAYKHTVVTTEHFKNNLEFFSGLDLTEDFKTYIWGVNTEDTEGLIFENPNHVPLSEKFLKSIL